MIVLLFLFHKSTNSILTIWACPKGRAFHYKSACFVPQQCGLFIAIAHAICETLPVRGCSKRGLFIPKVSKRIQKSNIQLTLLRLQSPRLGQPLLVARTFYTSFDFSSYFVLRPPWSLFINISLSIRS
jgi:hypothetical protein